MCNLHWCYTFCTDVTLFALVLHLNCTALSQSESSNFFMCTIMKVIITTVDNRMFIFTKIDLLVYLILVFFPFVCLFVCLFVCFFHFAVSLQLSSKS